ncbi:MAG: DMT family transporter [Paracoccaceae bacterium]
MSLWIPVTIFAAFMQNLRFMLQKHLKATQLSTGGATFSRFLYSAPLVAMLLWVYVRISGVEPPSLSGRFFQFALSGGVAQILATACVVALFAQRNFTVGIALKKSEVILTAVVGLVVLGEGVAPIAVFAILLGFAGIILLSDPPAGGEAVALRKRLFNAASGYGLGAGLLFGVSAVCYRGALLELGVGDPFLAAMTTLSVVTAWQVVVMLVWLRWREPGEIGRVLAVWRVATPLGIASMLGSIGWFVAFSLQNAAYVKALGQIELVFTFWASIFVFREKSHWREIAGVALIVASILFLVLGLQTPG